MEDHPKRVPLARADAADAVPHPDAVGAAAARQRALVDGKDDAFAAGQRDHGGAGLLARPLLGQDELATGEVAARPVEENATCNGKTCGP